MTYGTVQRANARYRALRGWDPNEPTRLTLKAPVAAGVVVLSGHILSLKWNATLSRYEWILGLGDTAANAPEVTPYIATQDSADFDVVGAGTLVGLSCSGDFEVQTAFYTGTDTNFTNDVLIAADWATTPGNVKVAASGEAVLGRITRQHGVVDLVATKVDSSCVNGKVVQWTTSYHPNSKKA